MTEAFERALAFVLEHEGGGRITDDPRDPGGLTRWGICQRSYPHLDIRQLTEAQAGEIYRKDYWLAGGCGNLPAPIALMHFDACVNQGTGAAARMLQAAARVTVDGHIGPKTLGAVLRVNARDLAAEYSARRMARYGETKGFDVYGLGWSRRLMTCLATALLIGEG